MERIKKLTFKSVTLALVFILLANFFGYNLNYLFKQLDVKAIEINVAEDKVKQYAEVVPETIITYRNGKQERIGGVKYLSSNEDILKLYNGFIFAKGEGKAIIKTSYLGKTAEKEIDVTGLNLNFNLLPRTNNSQLQIQNNTKNSVETKKTQTPVTYDFRKDIQSSKKSDGEKKYVTSNVKNEGTIVSQKEISDNNNQVIIGTTFKITEKFAKSKKDILIKYTFDANYIVKEENLNVFMKDEDGKLIELKDKPVFDTINDTVTFPVKGEGLFVIDDKEKVSESIRQTSNNTEEESAKKHEANRDKNIIEAMVDGNFTIDKEFLDKHKDKITFNYSIENKNVDENKLSIYRVVENNKLLNVEGVVLDVNANQLIAPIKSEGIYVIKEKAQAEKALVQVKKANSKVTEIISPFDIALSGSFGYSGSEITKEDVKKFNSNIPEGNGIWIAEKSREQILDTINKCTNNNYIIDEKGFLSILDANSKEITKSQTYSKLIDSLINGDKKVIISIDDTWLFYNKNNKKLERAKLGPNSGITIYGDDKNSIVFLGKARIDETGKAEGTPKNEVDNIEAILFHELIHSSREANNKSIEEKFALEQENRMRKELGYKERIVDINSSDIFEGDNAIYNYDQDIEIGESGPAVVELQIKLISLGMSLGGYGVTGYYGDYTVAAIKSIQQFEGFEQVGRYGPGTRAALTNILNGMNSVGDYFGKATLLAIYNEKVSSYETVQSDQDLEIGSSGPAVVVLQEKLLRLGFDLGGSGATGLFGDYTTNSLKAIQAYKGYETVGRYGPGTRAAIEELLLNVGPDGYYPEKQAIMAFYEQMISGTDLDPGANGDAVTILQQKLLRLGFDLGGCGATGYFGSYTVASLKAIQAYEGYETVGRYGPGTRVAIESLLSQIDSSGNYPGKSEIMSIYSDLLVNVELDPGQEGPEVVELQRRLLILGFSIGGYGATGCFGQYTQAAMKAIQEYYGYETVGRYGPGTRAVLTELYNKVDSDGQYPEKAALLQLYDKYVREFAAIDDTIDLNGSFIGNYVYYNQEDPAWAQVPYPDSESTIGNSGCGITSMAIVQATMKGNGVNPVEMAQYAINNGYCAGYTTRSFFSPVCEETRYKLNCERYSKGDLATVKRLLSDGKHMAIAIMVPGHFTQCGHYIVLSGVETIGGNNYFNVLDCHKDNTNYTTDGTMIYNSPQDGFVKARTNIFASECDEYWVYSLSASSSDTTDSVIQAKINLERLNYTGLRDTQGQLTSEWTDTFNSKLLQFLDNYGLYEDYTNLTGDKITQLFVWVQQAVNGQITKVVNTTVSETGTNNQNNETSNPLTWTGQFLLGITDAGIGACEGIMEMITHPIQTVESVAKLYLALLPGPLNDILINEISKIIEEEYNKFIEGNGNVKARMIGRAVGEILLIVIGEYGTGIAIDAIRASAKSGELSKVIDLLRVGEKVDDVVVVATRFAEAMSKARELVSALRNAMYDGELILKLADGRIFEPQKIAMAIDSTDPSNVLKHTYGFNRVWDANPSIGDDIIEVAGQSAQEIAKLYTENNLRTLYDNSFIDELFAENLEHFAELGVTKDEIITEMDKFRAMLNEAKKRASEAPEDIKKIAPDGTVSFEKSWSIENCAEVWAVRNAILSGVKVDNIMLRTITYDKGVFAPLCKNCQVTFEKWIEAGRIISD